MIPLLLYKRSRTQCKLANSTFSLHFTLDSYWLSDNLITCYEAMVVFLEVRIYRQMSIVYQFLCMKLQTRGNHSLPVIQEQRTQSKLKNFPAFYPNPLLLTISKCNLKTNLRDVLIESNARYTKVCCYALPTKFQILNTRKLQTSNKLTHLYLLLLKIPFVLIPLQSYVIKLLGS